MNNKARSLIFLSIFCFAIADARDGIGPFLGVFLQTNGWTPDEIGYAMTAGGLAGMLFTTPLGALADKTKRKLLILGISISGIVFSNVLIFFSTDTSIVWVAKILEGSLAAAVAPALTGVTLGLVGQVRLPMQLGHNEAWNHFGNCATALLGMVAGYYYGILGVFAVMGLTALLGVMCLGGINPSQIDHAVARGLAKARHEATLPMTKLLSNQALLAVAVTLFFFHLGNGAMLPLLGHSAVARFHVEPATYTAMTVFIAQTTMIASALWSARIARSKGYGFLFFIALAVLPLRGMIACY